VLLERIDHGRLICWRKYFETVALVVVPANHIAGYYNLRNVPVGNL